MTAKRYSPWVRILQIITVFIVSALISRASFVDNQSRHSLTKAKAYALAIPKSGE